MPSFAAAFFSTAQYGAASSVVPIFTVTVFAAWLRPDPRQS